MMLKEIMQDILSAENDAKSQTDEAMEQAKQMIDDAEATAAKIIEDAKLDAYKDEKATIAKAREDAAIAYNEIIAKGKKQAETIKGDASSASAFIVTTLMEKYGCN